VLKLVQDVIECLASKHLLGSKIAVNKVFIQGFLASSHSDGGVFGNGCLGNLLHNKTRDCSTDLSADTIRDGVVVHP
jgi:hypothetical protein